jgi:hypothetical protein
LPRERAVKAGDDLAGVANAQRLFDVGAHAGGGGGRHGQADSIAKAAAHRLQLAVFWAEVVPPG